MESAYNSRSASGVGSTSRAPHHTAAKRSNGMTTFKPIPTLSPQQESSFWERVGIDMSDSDACFPWKGNKNRGGYGIACFGDDNYPAHRIAYTLARGPIPDGLTLDHLCCNPVCCNPAHLDPCTALENVQRAAERRTHCPRGHRLPTRSKNRRRCEVCQAESMKLRSERLRDAGLCVACCVPSTAYRCESCRSIHNSMNKGRKRSGKHKGKSW